MNPVLPEIIPLEAVKEARSRIFDAAVRTPLIRFSHGGPGEIWLKLETLQPVGSFKIRGARNAIAALDEGQLDEGIYTASAGNMALGLAWCARTRRIPFTAIVPDQAPAAKLSKLESLGAQIVPVTFERWWRVLQEHSYETMPGTFIHPVASLPVMAGNGTIGLEVLEDLPGVDTLLVPFGGGGLSCGIASALRQSGSSARVMGCEIETATPLTAALAAGGPCMVQRTPSFVDGIGGSGLLPEMWPLVRNLIQGAVTVSLAEARDAIRALIERVHVVAEGAGAVPVAAALAGRGGKGIVCCVVSGGNIDASLVKEILGDL